MFQWVRIYPRSGVASIPGEAVTPRAALFQPMPVALERQGRQRFSLRERVLSLAEICRSTSTDGGVDGCGRRLAGRILDHPPLGEEGTAELEDVEVGAELGGGQVD